MEDCFSRRLLPALCCAFMRQVFPLAMLAGAGFFAACGGGPQKPTTVSTLPSAQPSATATAPAIDLSPVTMPESVVLLVHVPHAATTGDTVSEWAGQQLEIDSVLAEMVGERISKVVDLESPSDLVVTAQDRGARRDPEMRFAVSLSVKTFAAAKSTLQTEYGLLPIGNGAFEITRTGSHRHDGDSDFRVCALAPGLGGGRIVCSHDATSRDAMLPYLTRGTSGLSSI